jgi:hypothetical protein
MNARLSHRLVGSWTTDLGSTPDEMARLREIDAEPFEAAGPAEVEAFFRRYG